MWRRLAALEKSQTCIFEGCSSPKNPDPQVVHELNQYCPDHRKLIQTVLIGTKNNMRFRVRWIGWG